MKRDSIEITWASLFTQRVRSGAGLEQRDCLRLLPEALRTLQEKNCRIDLADEYVPKTGKAEAKEFSCGYSDSAISRFWNGSNDAHQIGRAHV